MFIRSSKINFPLGMQFEITIPFKDAVFKVPVTIKRLTKSNGYYDGMGVEILKLQKKYLELLIKLNLGFKP